MIRVYIPSEQRIMEAPTFARVVGSPCAVTIARAQYGVITKTLTLEDPWTVIIL